jgi:hypothetical protein
VIVEQGQLILDLMPLELVQQTRHGILLLKNGGIVYTSERTSAKVISTNLDG